MKFIIRSLSATLTSLHILTFSILYFLQHTFFFLISSFSQLHNYFVFELLLQQLFPSQHFSFLFTYFSIHVITLLYHHQTLSYISLYEKWKKSSIKRKQRSIRNGTKRSYKPNYLISHSFSASDRIKHISSSSSPPIALSGPTVLLPCVCDGVGREFLLLLLLYWRKISGGQEENYEEETIMRNKPEGVMVQG